MTPFPTHLRTIAIPRADQTGDEPIALEIICPCGGKTFRLLIARDPQELQQPKIPQSVEVGGDFVFFLRAECTGCGNRLLVFDAGCHGWDAVMVYGPKPHDPSTLALVWHCVDCGETIHGLGVRIELGEKSEVLENAGGTVSEERWMDVFSWFWADIVCNKCGLETDSWIDYETA